MDIKKLIQEMVSRDASDLFFRAEAHPVYVLMVRLFRWIPGF